MMLRRSCTWNHKPSDKVMNFEVESRNGTLHVMNDGLRLIGWNGIISSLGKS